MKYHQFLHVFPESALKMKQNKNICMHFSKVGILTHVVLCHPITACISYFFASQSTVLLCCWKYTC